jgi:Rab GDP dissociation inhibitor
MDKVYTYFGLEKGTKDFIGHAMALHLDDSYVALASLANHILN